MEKLYFRTRGDEPNVDCIDPCNYNDKPSENTMIGSASCQECIACYGWDREEYYIKCINHALKLQGMHVELAKK